MFVSSWYFDFYKFYWIAESLRNIPTRTRNVLLISLLAVAFLVALIAFILALVLAVRISEGCCELLVHIYCR